ncbi:hypothetical protein CRENBAI_013510 [Crenichthys baileyi]|uniref:Uncharacterized protein n=1 Tax=Crenichthys baileyi TaxID=28760 RepID=A0AAV9SN02_9TELE
MEKCFSETEWAALDLGPSRNRSSPAYTSSKPRRPCCKRSTPAAAAPTAAAPAELVTLTAASAEPSSPPPAAAEFPAGFSSRPKRRRRQRAAATQGVRVDASYASTEGPPATAFSRRFPRYGSRPDRVPRGELIGGVRGVLLSTLRFFPRGLGLYAPHSGGGVPGEGVA